MNYENQLLCLWLWAGISLTGVVEYIPSFRILFLNTSQELKLL